MRVLTLLSLFIALLAGCAGDDRAGTAAPSAPSRVILVTGATGTQGGAVARELLDRGFEVRAMTRSPDKPAAQALAELGAEVVQGNYDDAESIAAAMQGVT